jgi:hypothetical protein
MSPDCGAICTTCVLISCHRRDWPLLITARRLLAKEGTLLTHTAVCTLAELVKLAALPVKVHDPHLHHRIQRLYCMQLELRIVTGHHS